MSELAQLTELCRRLGADADQAGTMARQLLKRADQLAAERKITREEAMAHLLHILRHGREGVVPPGFQPPAPPAERPPGSE